MYIGVFRYKTGRDGSPIIVPTVVTIKNYITKMKEPEIVTITPKKLIGMQTETSLSKSKTVGLWVEFMPRRKEVKNRVGDNFFSIQVYPSNFKMADFTPETIFNTWAAVEVTDFENAPKGLECHELTGGLYAVFKHKGATSEFHKTASYIFNTWIPGSDYEVDNREHFEILGEKYLGPHHPDSEEDVWIPIVEKT